MITDPNLALLLASVGLLGIYVECCRPGRVVPGVLGAVALSVVAASLKNAHVPPSGPLFAALGVIVGAPGIVLARIAVRARRNKRRV